MTVALRLRELRTQQNLTYAAMSSRLEQLGHPIQPLAVRRMEEGDRAVDVDDLVALAMVLGVAPVTLLLPDSTASRDRVHLTGEDELVDALDAHVWARGIGTLGSDRRRFHAYANPEWLQMLAYSADEGGRIQFVTRGFETAAISEGD